MENKINKFQKILNTLIKYGVIIISVISLIIGVLSIFITAYFKAPFYHAEEKTYFKYSLGIINIVFSLLFFVFLLIISKKILKKIPSQIILIPILLVSAFLFFYWISAIKLNPESDQKFIHDMAISILNGNIERYSSFGQYLFLYPYQLGITLFVALIYKVFGENFLYIQYINAICSLINIVIIFYISKLLFKNENIQKILSLLLGGFSLYWMFFNVHFYGNIIGLTLALLATLFTLKYLDSEKNINLFLAGIFIILSIIVKTNYQIFFLRNYCSFTITYHKEI